MRVWGAHLSPHAKSYQEAARITLDGNDVINVPGRGPISWHFAKWRRLASVCPDVLHAIIAAIIMVIKIVMITVTITILKVFKNNTKKYVCIYIYICIQYTWKQLQAAVVKTLES